MENVEDSVTPILDNLDVDIVVKVLSNTIFSPFFVFWVPMFYRSQGAPWSTPTIVTSLAYLGILTIYWILSAASKVYRNGWNSLMPKKFDWGNQIVVITGGASGIGWLIATTLSVRNVTVAVLDVSPVERGNYDNIEYYKCDVSKWEEVEAVARRIQEELGHPTVIINNAGVVQGKLILDLEPEDVKQTFDTNVLSHFWTLKAFLPNMIKEKAGHIVTVSSVMGLVGAAQIADYCASKAAVAKLHESLRYELDKRYNTPEIRTTVLFPGHILTPLFSRLSLETAWWYKFLVPSLPPHTVAKAVIAAIDTRSSKTIFMPFYTNFVPWVGLLPTYARDFFQWLSKADHSMQGFVKVTGRRPEEGPAPPLEEGFKEE